MFSFSQDYDDDSSPWANRTELQNCLDEALPYAYAERDERGGIQEFGEGPVVLSVEDAVFCRSTDAFAGCMVVARRRFLTREDAVAWINEQDHDDDRRHYNLPPAPVVHVERTAEDEDELPF